MLNNVELLDVSSRIAEELRHLVSTRRWHERPDVLRPSQIRTLIGMACVTEVMSAHHQVFSARVAALADVLRRMFAPGPEPFSQRPKPTVCREALIYLALDDEWSRATLEARREEIARRRGMTKPERFRRLEDHTLRGLIAGHIAAYENGTERRSTTVAHIAEKSCGRVLECTTLSDVKDALLQVVREAKSVIICLGCPGDPSMEMYDVTLEIAERVKRPGYLVDIVIFGGPDSLRDFVFPHNPNYAEPNSRVTLIPVHYPFGPLLLGNDHRCLLWLPPLPDDQRLIPTLVAVEGSWTALHHAIAMAGVW